MNLSFLVYPMHIVWTLWSNSWINDSYKQFFSQSETYVTTNVVQFRNKWFWCTGSFHGIKCIQHNQCGLIRKQIININRSF